MIVPPALAWKCVRKNTCFMVKRNGVELTSEPGNVMNKNSFKYSGIANAKTVDIQLDGDDVVMGLKAPKCVSKPTKMMKKTPLKKDFRRVSHSIKTQVGGQWYRPDLTDMALARYSALYSAQMTKKGLKKTAKVKPAKSAIKAE